MDVRLLPAYLEDVLRHGWGVLLAVVGGVGAVATVLGDFPVPRWLWYLLIAIGVLAAQFGAYCDVSGELATVRGRLRELDTVGAKRAYLTGKIEDGERLRERIAGVGDDHWALVSSTYIADINHWESGVRTDLRESFEGDQDLLFDSDEGFEFPSGIVVGSRRADLAHLERRITRLRQIQEAL
jgi:hypothetical protein